MRNLFAAFTLLAALPGAAHAQTAAADHDQLEAVHADHDGEAAPKDCCDHVNPDGTPMSCCQPGADGKPAECCEGKHDTAGAHPAGH